MIRRPAALLLSAATFLAIAPAGEPQDDLERVLRKTLGQSHWYGVYLMGQKAGYARGQLVATTVDGRPAVRQRLDARMKITAMGKTQDMRLVEQRLYFRSGELHSVLNRLTTEASTVKILAVVRGDKLIVTSHTGPLVAKKELPAPAENLRATVAAERLAEPDARIGDQVAFRQFEPMVLKEVEAVCTLQERKTIVFNGVPTAVSVIQVRLSEMGVTSHLMVDEHGTTLEMTMGDAFVLRLEPEKQAKDFEFAGDIVRLGCIRLEPAPRNVARLREFRLRVEGIRDDMELINDARQQWTKQADGTYLLACRVPAFDPDASPPRPVTEERLADELKPSLFVQSDHPEVKALAREIVGEETRSWQAATRLADWVHKNLRKVGTAALSNAVETLHARQGDCTEHTVLFVALARAAGIPAREVGGVTAAEGGEGLYFHAWPEVWVGQWVAMDPTLGQTIADATHVKFTEGSTEQQFRIVSFIGRLKAQVLE